LTGRSQRLRRHALCRRQRGGEEDGVARGLLLALAIGVVCRLAAIPLPASPRTIGALLVVAMTIGFLGTDMALVQWSATP